jgi:surfactin synthase thioesterase subunit
LCYGKIIPGLEDYYVILCELDGHTDSENGLFISIEDCCDKIENYVRENLNGKLYGLSGFSMGATISVELMARHKIEIEKVELQSIRNACRDVYGYAISSEISNFSGKVVF